MLHFFPFYKNFDRIRITNRDCVRFAISLGVWSQFCLIKCYREMKANLLSDTLSWVLIYTSEKHPSFDLSILLTNFAYKGPPPSPSSITTSYQAVPKSSGLSYSYDQLDHSNWKLSASHIEISPKTSPLISFSCGSSAKCLVLHAW